MGVENQQFYNMFNFLFLFLKVELMKRLNKNGQLKISLSVFYNN